MKNRFNKNVKIKNDTTTKHSTKNVSMALMHLQLSPAANKEIKYQQQQLILQKWKFFWNAQILKSKFQGKIFWYENHYCRAIKWQWHIFPSICSSEYVHDWVRVCTWDCCPVAQLLDKLIDLHIETVRQICIQCSMRATGNQEDRRGTIFERHKNKK